jgi:hypothetical protein
MRGLNKVVAICVALSFALGAWAVLPAFALDIPSPQQDSGTITVNTLYPHIYDFDLVSGTGGGISVMNSQVDVDDGTGIVWYTLEAYGWYGLGGALVDRVDVWLWDDNGVTVADQSANIGGLWGPNRGVQLTYDASLVPTFQITSPVVNEWLLDDGALFSDFTSSGQYWYCNFTFRPYQQVWYAPGPFTELAGTLYGGGGNETQRDADNADPRVQLNDADTWDIKVVATDDPLGINAASAPSYDEFGTYMFTAIDASGWVNGGNVVGSGPPSTPNVPLTPSAYDWIFSANVQFDLCVQLTNLAGSGVPIIAATDIEIVGGNFAQANFGAANTDEYILGNVAASTGQVPREQGRTTTTSSFGGSQVSWWCDIQNVPEDTYVGTITYSLISDP